MGYTLSRATRTMRGCTYRALNLSYTAPQLLVGEILELDRRLELPLDQTAAPAARAVPADACTVAAEPPLAGPFGQQVKG